MPSRQFLVTQAVLNATETYRNFDLSETFVRRHGVPTFLDCMVSGDYVRESFCDQVRKEYSLLASRYQERNAA